MPRLVGNDPFTGEYNSDGLAERWEANEDFSVWTFHLHRGVPWHFDYGEVTAHDVVHSYALNVTDDSMQSGVGQLRGATVEALDDHTVSFTFDGPRIGFLFSVASRGSMLIYSKAQYDAEGVEGYQRRPAGTEHYRFVERLPGEKLVFERVEDHWSGQDAKFQELEFRWAPEPATKLARYVWVSPALDLVVALCPGPWPDLRAEADRLPREQALLARLLDAVVG